MEIQGGTCDVRYDKICRKQRKKCDFRSISFAILVAADQITKWMAVLHLKNQPAKVHINNVFELYYLENRGAAFGIFQGKRFAFLIITVVILLVLAYCFWNIPYTAKYMSLRCIIVLIGAGAVGNFIDRMSNGYVWISFFLNCSPEHSDLLLCI